MTGGGEGAAGSVLSGAILAQPAKTRARPNTIKKNPGLTRFRIPITSSIGNSIFRTSISLTCADLETQSENYQGLGEACFLEGRCPPGTSISGLQTGLLPACPDYL